MVSNLINANLFRLRRSVSTYVVIGAFAAFMVFVFSVMLGAQMISSGNPEFAGVAERITTDGLFQYVINGDVLCMFVAIGTVAFVHGESANGNLKNVYGKVSRKSALVISKTVSTIPMIISFVGIAVIASVIASLAYAPHCISFVNSGWPILRFVFVQILLLTAAASLAVCVSVITNSAMVTLIASFLFCEFGISVTSAVTTQLHKFGAFTFSDYTLLGNLYAITPDSSGIECLRAAAVAVAVIAVTTFIGSRVLARSDVK